MESITKKAEICKEEIIKKDEEEYIKGPQEFFDLLERWVRGAVRMIINKAINEEFNAFIGCLPYERTEERKDYRNGYLLKDFETRFGVIENILIPRVRGIRQCEGCERNKGFFPSIFKRWQRREGKIGRVISEIFLRGVSTRKIKAISKAIWGREYSASKVSDFNQSLKEEFVAYFNRPIEEAIRYLFLDAVSLKVRRNWISREALLCAIGITEGGRREFLGFILGGRESTKSWEDFLLHLRRRGLTDPSLIVLDGNAGLLHAIEGIFPGVSVQRCMVHKVRNIAAYCPKSLKELVVSEAKRIFYATNKQEAVSRFKEWEGRWNMVVPKAVGCLEKDLDSCLAFYSFPYRHWDKIRTTNIIERAFREFRRRIKVMDSFPTEESCIRIMFALAKLLNENWKHKPIKGF